MQTETVPTPRPSVADQLAALRKHLLETNDYAERHRTLQRIVELRGRTVQ